MTDTYGLHARVAERAMHPRWRKDLRDECALRNVFALAEDRIDASTLSDGRPCAFMDAVALLYNNVV